MCVQMKGDCTTGAPDVLESGCVSVRCGFSPGFGSEVGFGSTGAMTSGVAVAGGARTAGGAEGCRAGVGLTRSEIVTVENGQCQGPGGAARTFHTHGRGRLLWRHVDAQRRGMSRGSRDRARECPRFNWGPRPCVRSRGSFVHLDVYRSPRRPRA